MGQRQSQSHVKWYYKYHVVFVRETPGVTGIRGSLGPFIGQRAPSGGLHQTARSAGDADWPSITGARHPMCLRRVIVYSPLFVPALGGS